MVRVVKHPSPSKNPALPRTPSPKLPSELYPPNKSNDIFAQCPHFSSCQTSVHAFPSSGSIAYEITPSQPYPHTSIPIIRVGEPALNGSRKVTVLFGDEDDVRCFELDRRYEFESVEGKWWEEKGAFEIGFEEKRCVDEKKVKGNGLMFMKDLSTEKESPSKPNTGLKSIERKPTNFIQQDEENAWETMSESDSSSVAPRTELDKVLLECADTRTRIKQVHLRDFAHAIAEFIIQGALYFGLVGLLYLFAWAIRTNHRPQARRRGPRLGVRGRKRSTRR